jgi:hypothetical protein
MRPTLQFTLLLLLISPQNAMSQRSSPSIAGPVPIPIILDQDARFAMALPLAVDSVPEIRPTYWKEGALIGGLTLGLGLGFLAGAFCSNSDSGGSCGGATTGGFLLGGVCGGIIGALIGGQFPKEKEKES